MLIDFEKIAKEEITNFIGGDGTVVFQFFKDERNKIFKVTINPGCSVGFHKHEGSQEIMFLLSGEATVFDDDKTYTLKEGQVTYCPDEHSHGVKNNTDKPVVLICSVTKF